MDTVLRFFQEGGAFMYPILFMFALGIAIAIERFIYLSAAKGSNRRMWEDMLPHLNSGDFKRVVDMTGSSKVAIARIINYGLHRAQGARRREDIEMAMEEGLMEVTPRLERRTHYIGPIANVATLLGLLGTIIGLIDAFTAVANADPAQKADLLSASISVAMNTTAFGLMAAIPLLLIFSFLQSKTNEVVDSLEMATVKFLNIISEREKKSS